MTVLNVTFVKSWKASLNSARAISCVNDPVAVYVKDCFATLVLPLKPKAVIVHDSGWEAAVSFVLRKPD